MFRGSQCSTEQLQLLEGQDLKLVALSSCNAGRCGVITAKSNDPLRGLQIVIERLTQGSMADIWFDAEQVEATLSGRP